MKPPRTYTWHGLHALKERVMVRELAAIDQRTAAAQHLLGWREMTRVLLDPICFTARSIGTRPGGGHHDTPPIGGEQ